MSEGVKGSSNAGARNAGWRPDPFGKAFSDREKSAKSGDQDKTKGTGKISPSSHGSAHERSDLKEPSAKSGMKLANDDVSHGGQDSEAGPREPSERTHHGHQSDAVKHHGHQGDAVKHHGHQGHPVKHHGHQGSRSGRDDGDGSGGDGSRGKGSEGRKPPDPSGKEPPPPDHGHRDPPGDSGHGGRTPPPDGGSGNGGRAPPPDDRSGHDGRTPPPDDRSGHDGRTPPPPPGGGDRTPPGADGITGSRAVPGDGPVYRIPAGSGDQTADVQKALDEASRTHGTVEFEAGSHTMGATHVGSNTHIKIDVGAKILASSDHGAFPPAPNSQHKTPSALFNASRVTNVVIDGGGVIDGQGDAGGWYKDAADYKAGHKGDTHGMPRPRLISFDRSTDVTIKDITLQNSPKQHIVIDRSQNVSIENVNIYAPPDSPNTDGIDLGGDTNVIVRGGTIDVGDDNVAIEGGSGSGTMGPSSKILIDGQTYLHGHGVSIGSNTTAGVHDVTVSNATFDGTDQALRIKSSDDRGGSVSNINYENISISNVKHGAIDLNMNYSDALDWKWKPDGSPGTGSDIPSYSHITFDGIDVHNSNLGRIWGLSNSRIDDVVLANVHADGDGGPLSVRDATLKSVDLPSSQISAEANATILQT